MTIGLIKEGKMPPDTRVALAPSQCRWLLRNVEGLSIYVQKSETRCYNNLEYERAGVTMTDDLSACDIILGIKEVPINMLLADKTYLFFSHTKKAQPYNRELMKAMVKKNITLIDYECLEHTDGQRVIGFGFFAGIVGAHNGMMAYGRRTGEYTLGRVFHSKDYRELIHTYFGLELPNLKIAVTGGGRVSKGITEVMNLMDIREVEPEDYLNKKFPYPVYVHLKGSNLYRNKAIGKYERDEFHQHPEMYECLFKPYIRETDILMNGIYWDQNVPRLFTMEDMKAPDFNIQTIADITDDMYGSVPCNLGDSTIDDPVYGVNKKTGLRTDPYVNGSVDIMSVGNLPNELPRDASRYFGQQLIKHIFTGLLEGNNEMIRRATILNQGRLTNHYAYLEEYAYGN